ncbi:MAG: UDP-3-O-[3-hydroxymyristoyl] glucosamine N-acyltransferase, partial [Acidobacteriaceae bacterium]|nr:UDP-3-O-[3-hydroxymyristoyl] glucosamine N-acyltransferase [Acidobacteriaceae bacterium]
MQRTVREIAEFVQARVVGDQETELTGISSVASAKAGDLVFLENEKSLGAVLGSAASAIIAGEFASSAAGPKPLLISSHPRLAFARASTLFSSSENHRPGVHPSAVVHPSARLGRNVTIQE